MSKTKRKSKKSKIAICSIHKKYTAQRPPRITKTGKVCDECKNAWLESGPAQEWQEFFDIVKRGNFWEEEDIELFENANDPQIRSFVKKAAKAYIALIELEGYAYMECSKKLMHEEEEEESE